jgi:minor histocompatibility antigen H13
VSTYIRPYSRHLMDRFLRIELLSVSLRTPTIILFPLALIPSVLFNVSGVSGKSALITDILALSFSHNALSLLKIDSFKTGCILLSGLFFYDIYWVFGTDVVSSHFAFQDDAHAS